MPISAAAGLRVNIIGANISEMQQSMMSVFILQLIGDAEEIESAEAAIDQAGALRQQLLIDWESRTVSELPAQKEVVG